MKRNKSTILLLMVVAVIMVVGYFLRAGKLAGDKESPKDKLTYSTEFTPSMEPFEFGEYLALKPMKGFKFRSEATFSMDTVNFFTRKTGEEGEGSEALWYQKTPNSTELTQIELPANNKLFVEIVKRSNMTLTNNYVDRTVMVEKKEGIVTAKGEFIELINIVGEGFPLERVLVSHSLENDYEFLIVSKFGIEAVEEKFQVYLYNKTQGVVKQASLIDFFNDSVGFDSSKINLEKGSLDYGTVFDNIQTDGQFLYILDPVNKEIVRFNYDLSESKKVNLDNYEAIEIQYASPEHLFLIEMKGSVDSKYYVMTQELELISFEKFSKRGRLFLYNSSIDDSPLNRTINVVDFLTGGIMKKEERLNIQRVDTNMNGDMVISVFVNQDQQVREKLKEIGISFTEEEFSGDYFRNVLRLVKQEQLADFIEAYLNE